MQMVKKFHLISKKLLDTHRYKTVFVPFLGDNIGHLSPNEQLERGVNGIGTNVDLLNSLTPYKQPVYYYVKQEPVTVKPEFTKVLNLKDVCLLMVISASRLKRIKKINHRI